MDFCPTSVPFIQNGGKIYFLRIQINAILQNFVVLHNIIEVAVV